MLPVDESKIYCCYCRGEIHPSPNEHLEPGQDHQYHQECFDEIIKDNHCEYCSDILNELNSLFSEQHVKIHQKCMLALEELISRSISSTITDYLDMFPLKKLAKDCAFYEMNISQFPIYLQDLINPITFKLPDFSNKSEFFQSFVISIIPELIRKAIFDYTNDKLQVQFTDALDKCVTHSKKEVVDKILHFMWSFYLELPISYKDRVNHKIMFRPVSDNVNYTIFHYKLEKLFKTKLDFGTVADSNFNSLADYLLSEPISLQNLQI